MAKGRRINSHRKITGQWNELMTILQGLLITAVVAFLFYRSILGMVAGVAIIPFWLKLQKAKQESLAEAKMATEFKEYMNLIVSGLQTGYSLERAVKNSEEELKRLFPEKSVLMPHVHLMNQRLSMNVQLEKAFTEFARETGLEEAISLAEIITFAKRSGGDYGRHIRETALKIEDNLSIKQEIETITTEKRLELKVMCLMPMGILAYISLTSRSFIAPLYGNMTGILLMSVCLLAYGFLILLGKRIIDIRV